MFHQSFDPPRKTTRREFLRGSALFAAAVVGLAAPSRPLSAQDNTGSNANPPSSPPADSSADSVADPYKVTKLDSIGNPYRDCPECGGKMYKDDGKTWLCEACGYSYVE